MAERKEKAVLRHGAMGILGLLCVLAGLVGVSFAGPEPDPVPSRWELDVVAGDLRLLTVMVTDQETTQQNPATFVVFDYEVVNNSGQDLFFAHWFDLMSDDGGLVRSGRGVPREAAEAIVSELGNPLRKNEIGIQGRLLQGRENGRLGVAIWPAENLEVDEMTVYLMGFSGETRRVRRPDTGEEVTLRKSLMLRHATPGTLDAGSDDPLERTITRWVLR